MLRNKLLKESREVWLMRIAQRFVKPYFEKKGLKFPEFTISIGVPYKRNPEKVQGQCFDAKASADKKAAIFLSPAFAEPVDCVATMIHEIIHALLGNEAGHGKQFETAALKLGFEGPMKATPMGEELQKKVALWVKKSGKFPHAKLSFKHRKKQTTRLIKMECKRDKYIARASRSVIAEHGTTICPACKRPMHAEMAEE